MAADSLSSSFPLYASQPASNYDELFMKHRSIFAHNLNDMRNIREQLYSAAEHFECQYPRDDDQSQLYIESLKDYVTHAVISTVDHLGSVADKINSLLDQHVSRISETELRISCIKQRARTCQEYVDHEGISKYSLNIDMTKYHNKRYLTSDDGFAEVRKLKSYSSFSRRWSHSGLTSSESSSSSNTFSFTTVATNEQSGKRPISPLSFPLKRSGSVTRRSVSPSFPVKRMGSIANRFISPNSYSSSSQQFPLERRGRSLDMLYIRSDKERAKDIEVYSHRTPSLFKALLGIGINKAKKRYC